MFCSWPDALPPEDGSRPVHEKSDGKDSLIGYYCTYCFVRWPCSPSKTEVHAQNAYDAARAEFAKNPDNPDWRAILEAADEHKAANYRDFNVYDWQVPVFARGRQNPIYIYSVPDKHYREEAS